MAHRRGRGGDPIRAAIALAVLAAVGWALEHPEKLALGLGVSAFVAAGLYLFRRWRRHVWLRSHTELRTILLMSPSRFEEFCRELFAREGFRARLGRRAGDEDVDVELGGRLGPGIAQVKRWTGKPVGRPLLQQLYGEMSHRRAAFGYFVTTSWFTPEAIQWGRGKRITLIDGPKLERLASKHFGHYALHTDDIVPPAGGLTRSRLQDNHTARVRRSREP